MSAAIRQDDLRHLELLSGVPFFKKVPHEDIESLARTSVLRTIPAGGLVVVQGQYGHSMFVLVEGRLAVRATTESGDSLDLGRLEKPGEFFGEVALLGRGVRSASVIAETNTRVLEIEKNRFEVLARRHESIMGELEKYYHARSIATYTRLHRYLGQLPDDILRKLTAQASMRKFQRDDLVCRRGDEADTVMLVKDGVLKMVRQNRDGKLSILAYFNTHDVAGGHDEKKRTYDLVALGQAEIIFLPRAEFGKLAVSHPDVFARFSKDDMHRQNMLSQAGNTVFGAAQAFLQEGVEVESLLVINLDRCVRCGNCVRACHARHTFTRLDRRGPIFRRRTSLKAKTHEHLLVPSSCRHCRDPECMIGCPTGAIQRFPNGDVDINDNCIGCDNCARKCPYGNITMRPLSEEEKKGRDGVEKRAIKCNLCRGYSYSNCVHECPRGAVLRVDPLRYFDELALVMEPEQVDAIEWQREEAAKLGKVESKQRIKPRSTTFIGISLGLFTLACVALISAYLSSPRPRTGGTPWGLGFGILAANCVGFALFLGARKRMRNVSLGPLEIWTQFHMVVGVFGFFAALAHAGFKITGVFTTFLLLVFALEVASGIVGQAIYMIVPRILTRLERHGLARLVEDLDEEEFELEEGTTAMAKSLPPELGPVQARVMAATGGHLVRMRPNYDPDKHVESVRQRLKRNKLPEAHLPTVDRLITDVCRLKDVRAQLVLHRMLKWWLFLHLASAGALFVLLAVHIATMLLLY